MACGATLKRTMDFDPLSQASPKRRRCAPVSPSASPQKYLRMEPSPFGQVSSRLTTGQCGARAAGWGGEAKRLAGAYGGGTAAYCALPALTSGTRSQSYPIINIPVLDTLFRQTLNPAFLSRLTPCCWPVMAEL